MARRIEVSRRERLLLNLPTTGLRKHAKCPKCGAKERHRIRYVVVNNLLNSINALSLKMLHFAPEPFFRDFFSKRFGQYETADLSMNGADHNVDLQELPFEDQAYDFVFASHVLYLIPNDKKAISEIQRVLKPNGIAILPVPLVAEKTIEYPEPNPNETCPVRAPGLDYFDQYSRVFSKIENLAQIHSQGYTNYMFMKTGANGQQRNTLYYCRCRVKNILLLSLCVTCE